MPLPAEPPKCDLAPRKRRRKRNDPQSCFANSGDCDSDADPAMSCSDVESFQGKIVYNPDGSAYIIDSENDVLSNLSSSSSQGIQSSNNPKIHSFRVVTACDATSNISEPNRINKPILMCFICKLSFGNTKSFGLHASSEHALSLKESEKTLLNREYSSAIIQRNVDEKPQISFLEPLDMSEQPPSLQPEQSDILSSPPNAKRFSPSGSNVRSSPIALCSPVRDMAAAPQCHAESAATTASSITPTREHFSERSSPAINGALSPKSISSAGEPNPMQTSSGGEMHEKKSVGNLTMAAEYLQQQLNQMHQELLRCSTPSSSKIPATGDFASYNSGRPHYSNSNESASGNTTPTSSFALGAIENSAMQMNTMSGVGKLLNDFFQHQEIQQSMQSGGQCQEHKAAKSADCKSCDVKPNIHANKSPTTVNITPPSLTLSPTTAAGSFTIGACPEHISGRQLGVECTRCELILNAARLNTSTQISTRNSCKTLKCPQCNWHYKYQETLEIHMREKHPDGESACGYCLSGQQHPRLARGESYTCGYKPYRCEICNYSTTTKGNLSIHMQSDKHLNNMQELNSSQNLGAGPEIKESPKIIMQNMPQNTASKPKASFRCDVCSYETNVARNLRIHMTSEKHTHNMAVLQNNMKHFQTLSMIQSHNLGGLPAPQGMAGMNLPSFGSNVSNMLPEAAIADMAYNQALMIQLLHQNSGMQSAMPLLQLPANLPALEQKHSERESVSAAEVAEEKTRSILAGIQAPANPCTLAPSAEATTLLTCSLESDQGLNPDTFEPPIEYDAYPSACFSCLICSVYNTNSLEELNNHLLVDRTRHSNCMNTAMFVINNNYICRFCNYKTNLKANFQLHSKTDKHIQKLNVINHIKEGGPKNEYKLKYNTTNAVQLKCNCCDFYTNSIQKLNLHCQQIKHNKMKAVFSSLQGIVADFHHSHACKLATTNLSLNGNSFAENEQFCGRNWTLICQLCNFNALNLVQIVQHIQSIRHMQMDHYICMQRRNEGAEAMDVGQIFKICELDNVKTEHPTAMSLDAKPHRDSSVDGKCTPFMDSSAERPATAGMFEVAKTEPLCELTTDGDVKPDAAGFPLEDGLPHSLYKCNNCESFYKKQDDMEAHIAKEHPKAGLQEYIVIPTNPAIFKAFQAAVAAASAVTSGTVDLTTKGEGARSPLAAGMSKLFNAQEEAEKHLDVSSESAPGFVICPLCQDSFPSSAVLEKHLMGVHSVNSDGLTRLLHLVDTSHWLNNPANSRKDEAELVGQQLKQQTPYQQRARDELDCRCCEASFKQKSDLLVHANQKQHYSMLSDQYQCLVGPCQKLFDSISTMLLHFKDSHLNIVISERHVYKYRCKSCSLAFKTQEKLNAHSLYHSMRDATKCIVCNRNFRSTAALQKHVEQCHGQQQTGDGAVDSPNASPSSTQADSEVVQQYQQLKALQTLSEKELGIKASTPAEAQRAMRSSKTESPPPTDKDSSEAILALDFQKEIASKSSSSPTNLSASSNQQQQESCDGDYMEPQKMSMDPSTFSQENLQQSLGLNLPANLTQAQALQNLSQMGNIPMSTLDMLNIMQFHHLMSLNFMNLAPPLIFGAAGAPVTGLSPTPELPVPPIQNIQHQAMVPAQTTGNQKRARTRITDEQLRILRAHFDINNSPSEESITEMSQKANLPMKVVKHWFRNTLFKERQRNKDSPYNFSNPPSTTLNLEEYERTGKTKVTALKTSSETSKKSLTPSRSTSLEREQMAADPNPQPTSSQSSVHSVDDQHYMSMSFSQNDDFAQQDSRPISHPSSAFSDKAEMHIKTEISDEMIAQNLDANLIKTEQEHQQQSMFFANFETKSESGSSEVLSRPQTPNSVLPYNSLSDLISQQMDNSPLGNMARSNSASNMGPPKNLQMSKMYEKNNFETNSNSSNSSTSSGKRANRTRFTDYQIKVLQEFFENNSYPKDSDLEYLSKLLLLSPRVIVVWFQNARQKQRKIYENQPNNSFYETEDKKTNINYICKKCNLVFQRYYELIRHQKNHCFKEENNKKSAKAQIAAAQVAHSMSSEDSNSSMDTGNSQQVSGSAMAPRVTSPTGSQMSSVPLSFFANNSDLFGGNHMGQKAANQSESNASISSADYESDQLQECSTMSMAQNLSCDKCNLSFEKFELFKEHQLIHAMNPTLLFGQNYSESSLFGGMQDAGSKNDMLMDLTKQRKRKHSNKLSADELCGGAEEEVVHKKSKTDQIDFLYQYFLQNENNDELKKKIEENMKVNSLQNFNIEYLSNFYQQQEMKKHSNYEFLYQYYMQNEAKSKDGSANNMKLHREPEEKPHINFLIQYYHLHESKRFFLSDAWPSKIPDYLEGRPEDKHISTTAQSPTSPVDLENPIAKLPVDDSALGAKLISSPSQELELAIEQQQQQQPPQQSAIALTEHRKSELKADSTHFLSNIANTLGNNANLSTISAEKQSSKRLRTTILPEQLNFLYECYQNESNPSRKMLEEISKKVNLKKRVVQVWYQNSRARERKGQFRQNLQIINKKCPHCGAIFKIKTALELHLNTKHPDVKPISVEQIPDAISMDSENAESLFYSSYGTGQLNNVNPVEAPVNMFYSKSQLNGKTPMDLSKANYSRYGNSESEISFSDSNDCDESYDFDSIVNNLPSKSYGDISVLSMEPSQKATNNIQQYFNLRSEISNIQLHILKMIFQEVPNPSVVHCGNIGRQIGLKTCVIQMWFQNARAKVTKSAGDYDDGNYEDYSDSKQMLNQCKICNATNVNVAEHITTVSHIAKIRQLLRSPVDANASNGDNSDTNTNTNTMTPSPSKLHSDEVSDDLNQRNAENDFELGHFKDNKKLTIEENGYQNAYNFKSSSAEDKAPKGNELSNVVDDVLTENNFLVKINSGNSDPNNKLDILQQMCGYGKMSVIGGK